MKYILFYIFNIFLIFNINVKEEDDIFEITKNLYFCGVDLPSQKIQLPKNLKHRKINNNRSLKDMKYRPIRIYIETTFFDYQGSLYPGLNESIPVIKASLTGAVEAIKDLIEVEDKDNMNLFDHINSTFFSTYGITKWNNVFDKGSKINSDFLIVLKYDLNNEFPPRVIASALPIAFEQGTYRPIVGLLTITKDTSYYSYRRVREYFRLVLLHELTHALGFLYDMFPLFPGGRENTYTTEIIRYVNRTIIKTPKVVEIAKKYFNCSNIKGVELEDQGSLGSALSHWEQRILLGDYMGAIIYQEEMAISEITLALLEDTGWYKTNYYTGGLMRFGKNRGCRFLYNNCLDENFKTEFDNEFFDLKDALKPSCSTGRQSRTYSLLYEYDIYDANYYYNFYYDQNRFKYSSGAMYTTDYCFTHGQLESERDNGYFTGNCLYGKGSYGSNIYYFNYLTLKSEMGHPNSEFPEDLGEVYSNISFCIMSTLTPSENYDSIFYTVPHPICYQILCSSFSLTIKINNDYVVCPREGGKVKLNGYVGFIICPDYNLICTGTQVCNDIIDCIEKKSLFKENTFNYDYIPVTTQSYSKILLMTIVEAYELGDDGFCPKYCAQCDINKKCKKCKEGYNLIGTKDDDDKPIICDNTINIESELYYKNKNSYYLCNEECNGCIDKYDYCLSCKDNYYSLIDGGQCHKKEEIIEGYYFNEELKVFSSCYKYCKTCSAEGISDNKMNCDSCINDYIYEKNKKNCVKENIFKKLWNFVSITISILIVLIILVVVFFFRTKNKDSDKKKRIKINEDMKT